MYGLAPGMPPVMLMPPSVRAARIVAQVLAGLIIVTAVAIGVVAGPEAAGEVIGSSLLTLVVASLSWRFHCAGNGLRITSIILSSMQIFFALGAVAEHVKGGGVLPLGSSIALVTLLSQSSAKAWFTRPFHAV
ncbi:hypothetical protein [Streptomyces sp. VRA16 Mangrove soil]|uniref:hypothetical protein n=1 Tax=Streptomyces sp. VRA16 Mangrove soil TaxID=2817434 RepID=UPI001A9D630E|nr:hypothetical protein [Streptomyces sp. VRA16 Mangrove soil]MBO1329728.1 hypothetical protein [Streptomyces sp. VRA16 Mangrove soil]